MAKMAGRKAMTPGLAESRIPTFQSVEEAAEFWDTHDTSEFEHEFEDVTEELRFVVMGPGPRKTVSVRMDQRTYDALCQAAAEYHARPSKVALLWIQERLYGDRTKAGKTSP